MEAVLFIGTVIAGVTQFMKLLFPQVNGAYTIAVSVAVGALVALVDTSIGVPNITVAQGLSIGFGAAGVVGTVKQISTPSTTNYNGRAG